MQHLAVLALLRADGRPAADGSGFTSFATADPAKGPVVEVGDPVPAGGGFLTSEAVIDGQSSRPRIVYSVDGVSKAKLLVPVDASGGEDATAVYAHTHLAWLRGFEKSRQDLPVARAAQFLPMGPRARER